MYLVQIHSISPISHLSLPPTPPPPPPSIIWRQSLPPPLPQSEACEKCLWLGLVACFTHKQCYPHLQWSKHLKGWKWQWYEQTLPLHSSLTSSIMIWYTVWYGSLICLLTVPVLRLLSSKAQGCKDFWKPSKPCHVGTHWIALAEFSQMSTHLPGFQWFFRFFALFCIG